VVHISDGKDSQTVKDFVETLEQQNGKKEQVKAISYKFAGRSHAFS
jgi:hypothetical protein